MAIPDLYVLCGISSHLFPFGKLLLNFRMLIFSRGSIEKVKVKVDEFDLGRATHVDGPLFVLPWKAKDFSTGIHQIEVHVKVKWKNGAILVTYILTKDSQFNLFVKQNMNFLSIRVTKFKYAHIVEYVLKQEHIHYFFMW